MIDDVLSGGHNEASLVCSGVAPEWFVYMVECVDGTIYTGCTTDVTRRLREHNGSARGAKYTRSRRPVTLRWFRTCQSRSEALRVELQIKALPRAEKLALIAEQAR